MENELIELELKELQQTEFAFLLWDGETIKNCRRKGHWVPKSMCEKINEGIFQMPEWLATEKRFV